MSTEANPVQEAMSVMDAVDAMYPGAEEATPEVDAEEAQNAEPVESTEEAATEPEEEVEAADDEQEADEPESDDDPQHLSLDEYGDLTIPIKVNGEEQRITLAEAAKGYQMEADYRRKTSALAEERKAVEAAQSQSQEQIAQMQQQIASLLAETIGEPPNLELAEEDPYEYTVQKAKWDARREDYQRKRQEAEAHTAEMRQRQSIEGAQRLIEAAPEFQDSEYIQGLVNEATQVYGVTQQELAATNDYRIFLALKDAIAYRKSQKVSPKVEKALSKPRKVLKPGAARTSGEMSAERKAAAKRKLAKPGGVSIEEYLNAKFG